MTNRTLKPLAAASLLHGGCGTADGDEAGAESRARMRPHRPVPHCPACGLATAGHRLYGQLHRVCVDRLLAARSPWSTR